ncbi:hypothetical protein GJAV_G00011490 [Gymnothorax javanicus]|nr:hypothetical protein GJAV_G00011490 [Gymnothorax javanicus]
MDFFTEPVKSDCENLLSQFQRSESVRYEEFAVIWRIMEFPSIFYGKMAPNETRAFTRLVLTTAYPYLLPPYNFQIRVGGLYLLYGLYNAQLAVPKEKSDEGFWIGDRPSGPQWGQDFSETILPGCVKFCMLNKLPMFDVKFISIALKDWENIMKFQQDAMNAQHYDVCYIFRKLVNEKAFYFSAMPKHLSFQVKRKPKRQVILEEFRDRPARVKELITTEMVEEIANVEEHYEKVKAAISATPGQPDSAISLINKDLSINLEDTMKNYQKWLDDTSCRKNDPTGFHVADAGEGSSQKAESSRRAALLASIKSKSYGQRTEVSKSRRHRKVEMDTSASEAEHVQESSCKRQPSLRARTRKYMLSKGHLKQEIMAATKQWRLSLHEKDESEKPRLWRRFKY